MFRKVVVIFHFLSSFEKEVSDTPPVFDCFLKNIKPCKCLSHKALSNEAEGARTLNLRIDSPN